MKRPVSTALVIGATFVWLAALFAMQPFDRVNAAMDRAFGALPAWTQVENMYRDPATQEVSRGDAPLESFRLLAESWAAHPGARRIVLMGNSQTLMTSLAAGEPPPSGSEKTYTDQIAEHYRQAGAQKLFYRLSAGALSYQEMLWYGAYLANRPEIRPDILLAQLNYQNFVNGGIRGGMLSLLADDRFRHSVEEMARGEGPDAEAFAEALHHYQESQSKAATPNASASGANRGFRLETAFREKLDRMPKFRERAAIKESFVFMLYRCRTYLLHVAPSTRRSLGGSRVAQSRAALEHLAALCGRAGIRLILFQAPTNPAVPLYATAADDGSYHDYIASLASRRRLTVLDFEHGIPGRYWGMSLNVPDPLHLGREGHRLMAGLMLRALEQNGI